jgi:PAS domain S-box-containing protein
MDLRTKTLIVVGLSLLFVLIVFVLAASTVMQGSYAEIETQQMVKDVSLVASHINYELDDLDAIVLEHAQSNETWLFVQDKNEEYIRDHLNQDIIPSLRVDTAVFLDQSGQLIYGLHYDHSTGRTTPVRPDELSLLIGSHELYTRNELAARYKGFIRLSSGPAMVSSQPVRKSESEITVPGWVIMVRNIDSREIEMLSHNTGLVISLLAPDSFYQGDEYLTMRTRLPEGIPVHVVPFTGNLSTGYALFSDPGGADLFVLRIDSPPSIFYTGLKAMYTFLVIVFIIGLGLGLLGLFLLDTMILGRLNEIIRSVRLVGRGDGSERVTEIQGNDELSELATAINTMLNEISLSHQLIRESEQRYRGVVEDQTELICRFRADGVISFINKSFEKYFPVTGGLSGVPGIFDIVHDNDKSPLIECISRLTNERPAGIFEQQFESGERKGWIEWTVRAIYAPQNTLREYQLVGRDVTITREATLELRRYRDHLQEIVKHRTNELMEAREELQKAERLEAIGLLAGGIAHDFNNFLSMILGNIEILKDQTNEYPELAARVRNLELATIQASALTRQMLTFAKGGGPLKKKTNLCELVTRTTDFVCRGSEARCEIRCDPGLPPVEVDPSQIEQVITNILINARHAMPEGGLIVVEVLLVTNNGDPGIPLPEGSYAKVVITDQGHGISKENLSKIFNPFFTTKPTSDGLGLTISLSIVRKHGGYITVISEPGKGGSSFIVYLPAMISETNPGPHEVENGVDQAIPYRKPRVLVMDDEAGIRDVLVQMLSSRGVEVVPATDGKKAIEAYRKAKDEGRKFDVVILDLTVPEGMGGKEALEQLMEIDPDVKAIVASGYSNDPIMSEYKKFGFSGVMPKPFVIKDLYSMILSLSKG